MSIVVLISGRGSNMQALVEAGLPVNAVISNRADAAGLAFASEHGIATAIVDHRGFATRDAFDAALAQEIDRHAPALVVLAGFMRILRPTDSPTGTWFTEQVDLAADYRQAFGEDPPNPAQIAIQADTDNTQSASRAMVADLVFAPRDENARGS